MTARRLLLILVISVGILTCESSARVRRVRKSNRPSNYRRFSKQTLRNDMEYEFLDAGFRNSELGGIVASGMALKGTVVLNKILDEAIANFREDIIEMGKDQIGIPDFNKTFTRKIGGMKVRGDFEATHGWAKNMSSLYRTDDVIVTSNGNELVVWGGFGLKHLEVGYDKYKISFKDYGPQGKLNVMLNKNSLWLNITLKLMKDKTVATINDLKLDQFGEFRSRITGLGPLNWMFERITMWLFEKYKSDIKGRIEKLVKDELTKYLPHLNFESYIPFIAS